MRPVASSPLCAFLGCLSWCEIWIRSRRGRIGYHDSVAVRLLEVNLVDGSLFLVASLQTHVNVTLESERVVIASIGMVGSVCVSVPICVRNWL